MAKGVIRKRCTECKRVAQGRANKYERCDRCGAEMVPLRYGNAGRKPKRAGRI